MQKYFWFIFLTVAGCISRFYRLGHDQFWMDEAYSALVSALPLQSLLAETPGLGSPPLYNLFLHFWIKIFGNGEWALRFPSALIGALFVPLVYAVGRRWFNEKAGILAAVVALVSGVHLFYSQQARLYSFWIFLSLLSAHWLLRFFVENRSRFWWGYTVTLILLLYLHNWSLFLIPLPYIYALLEKKGRTFIRKIIFSHVLVFLCYLPFLPLLLAQASSGSSSWIAYFVGKNERLWAFFKTFEIFFAGGDYLALKHIPSLRFVAIALLCFLLIVILKEVKPRFAARKFFLIYLITPILILYLLSFYHPLYVAGRYDMIVFPAFCILIGTAFSKLRRAIFIPTIGLFLILSSINLAAFYWWHPPRQENRQMATLLKEKGQPGDVLLFTGFSRAPVQYYLGPAFSSFRLQTFPSDAEKNLGYFDYPRYLAGNENLPAEAMHLAAGMKQVHPPPRRIWVVYTRWLSFIFGKEADYLNEPLFEALFAHCRLVALHPFRKAFILEMELRSLL